MNTHVRERAIFVQTTPALRRRLAQMVDDLIGLMDQLDGDADLEAEPDLEDGHDAEPSLGWAESEARRGRYAHRTEVDAERDDCDREVTMPSAGDMPGWDDRQDVSPRLQGYATPDEAEDGHDAEPADFCP